MIKEIFKMSIFIIIFTLLFSIVYTCEVSATDEIISGADKFIQIGIGDSSDSPIDGEGLRDISNTIYNILLILGTVIAVIIGVVLGLKFITGSVEQKANIKEMLMPYVMGCVVIFGAFGIWKLVVEINSELVPTEGIIIAETETGDGAEAILSLRERFNKTYDGMNKDTSIEEILIANGYPDMSNEDIITLLKSDLKGVLISTFGNVEDYDNIDYSKTGSFFTELSEYGEQLFWVCYRKGLLNEILDEENATDTEMTIQELEQYFRDSYIGFYNMYPNYSIEKVIMHNRALDYEEQAEGFKLENEQLIKLFEVYALEDLKEIAGIESDQNFWDSWDTKSNQIINRFVNNNLNNTDTFKLDLVYVCYTIGLINSENFNSNTNGNGSIPNENESMSNEDETIPTESETENEELKEKFEASYNGYYKSKYYDGLSTEDIIAINRGIDKNEIYGYMLEDKELLELFKAHNMLEKLKETSADFINDETGGDFWECWNKKSSFKNKIIDNFMDKYYTENSNTNFEADLVYICYDFGLIKQENFN